MNKKFDRKIEGCIEFIGMWLITSVVFVVLMLFVLNPYYYPYINKPYIKDYYTCRHFSEDFALLMKDTHNISVIVGVVGEIGDVRHAWVEVDGVQYEVTGGLTRKILWFEGYKEDSRYNTEAWIKRNDMWDSVRDNVKMMEMSK